MKIVLQKWAAPLLFALVFIGIFYVSMAKDSTLVVYTSHGDSTFSVEVARTDAEREQGLMFRKELAADHGMLFPFNPPQPVTMWMKNTLIPLDMFFITPDGSIARIEENAKPESLDYIQSNAIVGAVLEVPGGTAQRIGAHMGDHVSGGGF